MTIHSFWFDQLPQDLPTGIYVVIDVWGATSNMSIMLNKRPQRLFVVNDVTTPQISQKFPHAILIGDSTNSQLKFAISNLPHHILQADLMDKVIIYRTVNGTKVFETLRSQPLIIGCGFNNVSAVAQFLKTKNQPVIIIMAGEADNKDTGDETSDQFGKDTLVAILTGQSYDWNAIQQQVRHTIQQYEGDLFSIKAPGVDVILQKDSYRTIPAAKISTEGFLELYDLS